MEIAVGMKVRLSSWKPDEYVRVFRIDGNIFKGSYVGASQLEEFPCGLKWLSFDPEERFEVQNAL